MPNCGEYEIQREGDEITIRIECDECTFFPSIEDSPKTMSMVMEILAETGTATRVILHQKRDYEYDYNQTMILLELAKLYKDIIKHKLKQGLLATPQCRRYVDPRYVELQNLIFQQLKSDPVGTYVQIKRTIRKENNLIEKKIISQEGAQCLQTYYKLLNDIAVSLENTQIIKLAQPHLAGFKIGDRDVYRLVFSPLIKPDFMYTKLISAYPPDAEAT
ncbi:hypothetical protein KY333_05410, partial [Candidatus Woesearchaeota archaeon]|nr:hypothetical protein [Candidatus Woesearchaeota archaeon]